MADKSNHGRSPADICEGEVGGVLHKAMLLSELGGDLEGVIAEWEHDEAPLAVEFVDLCRDFLKVIDGTHLADDGSLVDALTGGEDV